MKKIDELNNWVSSCWSIRKGDVFLVKIYSVHKHGPWNQERPYKRGEKQDRSFVEPRLRDELLKRCSSWDLMCEAFSLNDDVYLVCVKTRVKAKKFEALKELGYEVYMEKKGS